LARFGEQAAVWAEPPGVEAARQRAQSAGSATHRIGLQTTWR